MHPRLSNSIFSKPLYLLIIIKAKVTTYTSHLMRKTMLYKLSCDGEAPAPSDFLEQQSMSAYQKKKEQS